MKNLRLGVVVAACACVVVSGCGKKPAVAKTPDKAVMNAVQAIKDNKPQALFTALPASYQTDINTVVSEAATKMDTEIWNEGQGLLKQVLKIAKTKKDLLLQSQMLANNPKKDEVSQNWDQAIDMLSTVINSDFANLNKLRKADVAALLAGSGATIMKKAKALKTEANDEINKLDTVKATLISQEGDAAKVKIEAKGEDPETEDFVRIEGKWIPKDMADEFKDKIKEARESIAKIDFSSKEGQAKKAQVLKQIKMAKSMLKNIENAKTKEEMDGALMGMMMGVMMSAKSSQSAPPPPSK